LEPERLAFSRLAFASRIGYQISVTAVPYFGLADRKNVSRFTRNAELA
jgi:hypothetical protein